MQSTNDKRNDDVDVKSYLKGCGGCLLTLQKWLSALAQVAVPFTLFIEDKPMSECVGAFAIGLGSVYPLFVFFRNHDWKNSHLQLSMFIGFLMTFLIAWLFRSKTSEDPIMNIIMGFGHPAVIIGMLALLIILDFAAPKQFSVVAIGVIIGLILPYTLFGALYLVAFAFMMIGGIASGGFDDRKK